MHTEFWEEGKKPLEQARRKQNTMDLNEKEDGGMVYFLWNQDLAHYGSVRLKVGSAGNY